MADGSRRKRTGAFRSFEGLQITVFAFLVFQFFVFLQFFDRLQLERIHRHDLEVGAALGAGDDFAFIDLILFDVEVAFTLWTINHECLRTGNYPDIFNSPGPAVKSCAHFTPLGCVQVFSRDSARKSGRLCLPAKP